MLPGTTRSSLLSEAGEAATRIGAKKQAIARRIFDDSGGRARDNLNLFESDSGTNLNDSYVAE
jgi:hypothetical protein